MSGSSTPLRCLKSRKVGSMKKHALWLPLILMAMFASSAVSAKAQSTNGIRANVPFDFIVGDKTLPAGKITVRELTASGGPLSIANTDTGQHVLRLARASSGRTSND